MKTVYSFLKGLTLHRGQVEPLIFLVKCFAVTSSDNIFIPMILLP